MYPDYQRNLDLVDRFGLGRLEYDDDDDDDDDEVLVFVVLREPRTAPIAARPALSWRRARTFET